MKKKILIGSVFAALVLLLSMPFVSTLQAAPAPPYESNIVMEKDGNGLGSICVYIYFKALHIKQGISGVTVILMENDQVVKIGITNFNGVKCFYSLQESDKYTVTFSYRGKTSGPIKVEWNSYNSFNADDIDISEGESIESSVYNIIGK